MNLAKLLTDLAKLEADGLKLAADPAAAELAGDIAAVISDFGLDAKEASALATGAFDRFQDFTAAFSGYHLGKLSAADLESDLAKPKLGRTPNPQRICNAIAIANIVGPLVAQMVGGGYVWTPIPEPAYCLAPIPAGAAMESGECQRVAQAVVAGLFAAA